MAELSDVERDYNFGTGAPAPPPWGQDARGMGVSPAWLDRIRVFHERANVGEEAPDFTAQLLDGGEFRLSSLRGSKNLFLMLGSLTDPPCITNLSLAKPSLKDLYQRYQPHLYFLWIYTREAHPGKYTPPHNSMEEKIARARQLKEEEKVPFPILVDQLDGQIHRLYGSAFNNMTFVINKAGVIASKSMFLDSAELPAIFDDLIEWERVDAEDRVIKKSYTERLRMCREPYDPACQKRILQVLERTHGPMDYEDGVTRRGFDIRDWKRAR